MKEYTWLQMKEHTVLPTGNIAACLQIAMPTGGTEDLASAESSCQLPVLADNTPNPSMLFLALSKSAPVWASTSGGDSPLTCLVLLPELCAYITHITLQHITSHDMP